MSGSKSINQRFTIPDNILFLLTSNVNFSNEFIYNLMCKYSISMSDSFNDFLKKIYPSISIFNHQLINNDINIFWNETFVLKSGMDYDDFLLTYSTNRSGIYELPLVFKSEFNNTFIQNKYFYSWLGGNNVLDSDHILLEPQNESGQSEHGHAIQMSNFIQSVDSVEDKILFLITDDSPIGDNFINLKDFYILQNENNDNLIRVYNEFGDAFLENVNNVLNGYNVATGLVHCENGNKYFVDQNQIKKYIHLINHIDILEYCLVFDNEDKIKIVSTIDLLQIYDCFTFPQFNVNDKNNLDPLSSNTSVYKILRNNESKIMTLIEIKNDPNKILTMYDGKFYCFDLINVYNNIDKNYIILPTDTRNGYIRGVDTAIIKYDILFFEMSKITTMKILEKIPFTLFVHDDKYIISHITFEEILNYEIINNKYSTVDTTYYIPQINLNDVKYWKSMSEDENVIIVKNSLEYYEIYEKNAIMKFYNSEYQCFNFNEQNYIPLNCELNKLDL